MNDDLLNFHEALRMVLRHAGDLRPGARETVGLEQSLGRVLAEAIVCDRDQPPFDRSTRDGFAMRAGGGLDRAIVGSVRAGEHWVGGMLHEDDAVEIMTGAPVPPGTDAVVMVEHVTRNGERLHVAADRSPSAGQNVVPQGAEMRAGEAALPVGTLVGAAEIAIAASVGAAQVQVYRRPVVAVLATGDELVELDERPEPQQIRNSNGYALAALVRLAGGEARRLPIARDTTEALEEALEQARACDLLLLSGGVSAGKYDLVEEVLARAGATFHFTGVRMQPGKPVVFGWLPRGEARGDQDAPETGEPERPLPFFGLPGNPVSTQVTFRCFAAPFVRALAGEAGAQPWFAEAALRHAVEGRPGLTRLLPARLKMGAGGPEVELVTWQGSGDLRANARANCYALLPEDRPGFAAGERVSILLR